VFDFFSFWGKSRRAADGSFETHALVCHLLDVAAVADVLLERFPTRLEWLATLLDAEPAALRGMIVRLAALHDIGKFHPDFQRKLDGYCEKRLPELIKYIDERERPIRHDILGFMIAEEIELPARFEAQPPSLLQGEILGLIKSAMLHHGRPADEPQGAALWRKALLMIEPTVSGFIEEAFPLIPCDAPVLRSEPSEARVAVFSWALAGLIVLADWIGSNEDFFAYHTSVEDLSAYWNKAKDQAAKAVDKVGILAAASRKAFDPRQLLPHVEGKQAELSPLQLAAATLPIVDGPQLFIVEDMTGAGKTEAALILAQRLLASGAASGFYFALPTMATSNAMYDRMAGVYRRLFAEEAHPSLVLAHGRRDLNDTFTGAIFDSADGSLFGGAEGDDADETAQNACARWIADDRRKAFFAHVGVGTVDQALLAVLPRKHQALRLWALADRILIVDEAHAYDAYVSRELERLIEFHAALGGSTVILSATLSDQTRKSLVEAWRKGVHVGRSIGPCALGSDSYPLVTAVSRESVEESPVKARAELSRSVPLHRVGSFDEAAEYVAARAKDGAPVAWIRNAVDDAIEACESLEKFGLEPLLLHARFAMGDRIERERIVQERLGRRSKPEERRGFVLVGTQILEQSLDYDVDAMVSDLAPVDLIIQRAGRLWRHPNREGRLASRELFLFSPDPAGALDANWYRSMSKRAAAVYGHHGLVWRSAKALFVAGEIRTPDGLRELIAKVYGPDELATPDVFDAAEIEASGKDQKDKSIAGINLLTLEKGYGGDNAGWTSDLDISTRLEEEPSITFRLARLKGGAVVPWRQPDDKSAAALRRAWALSEVRVQKRLASEPAAIGGERALAASAAKEEWGKWERDIPLLLLEGGGDGEPWRCEILREKGQATAYYDTRLGLRIKAQ
jgi:CRISPR-associated endonuclease/helicase Cas3